jgi:hypothetical protein
MRRIAAIVCFAALAGCSIWPTGQDPYGMEQRREANAVMEAVQSYDHATGAFPRDLNALVPAYLASLPENPRLQYDARDGSLSYQYRGSWPQLQLVNCLSEGNTTIWKCSEMNTKPG